MLAGVPASAVATTRIPARLHALLAEMTGQQSAEKDGAVTTHLDSASTEELFAFIDNEL
ncbi:hypothetical protein [Streptomyces sp. IMTB 2501]|uniref:hypothetical protein n=1 Tax=Streptomyces sp. IMTB 2501 TaxID=1776340 RepID=UPI002116D1FD|nr:hypothetical protein [Streptomyces sp. IMTB 2501]